MSPLRAAWRSGWQLVMVGLVAGCLGSRPPEIPPTPPRTALPTPASQSSGEVPAVRADAAIGALYFEAYCTSCHGRTGAGDGPAAPPLRPPPTDFTDRAYMLDQTPAWYFRAITRGVPGAAMQSWDHRLDPGARWDTVFYVWSLAVDPGELASGAELYAARCTECHGANGADEPAARLDEPARVSGSRNTVAGSLRALHPEALEGLGDEDVAALVEFTWTFLYAPDEASSP